MVPDRKFVFGRPNDDKTHSLALLGESSYDQERNIYATIELDIKGRSRNLKIVWLQPE